jgi:hypothetical protein
MKAKQALQVHQAPMGVEVQEAENQAAALATMMLVQQTRPTKGHQKEVFLTLVRICYASSMTRWVPRIWARHRRITCTGRVMGAWMQCH